MLPVPKQENPCWPMSAGEAAVSRRMSSRAALSPGRSATLRRPVPCTAMYLRFFCPATRPRPQRPAAWCVSMMRLAKRQPVSAAGPVAAMEPLGLRWRSRAKTSTVSSPVSALASTRRTSPSSISMPVGRIARPTMSTASQPARASSVPSRPPALESATAPVSGERVVRWQRPEVGAMVAFSGPTARISGRAGSPGARVAWSRRR